MDFCQEITKQREEALKQVMTQENRDAAKLFLEKEVGEKLRKWWKPTANYRCITFYNPKADYVAYNLNTGIGCNLTDSVYDINPDVLSVAVELAPAYGISGVEFLEQGMKAWRFSVKTL